MSIELISANRLARYSILATMVTGAEALADQQTGDLHHRDIGVEWGLSGGEFFFNGFDSTGTWGAGNIVTRYGHLSGIQLGSLEFSCYGMVNFNHNFGGSALKMQMLMRRLPMSLWQTAYFQTNYDSDATYSQMLNFVERGATWNQHTGGSSYAVGSNTRHFSETAHSSPSGRAFTLFHIEQGTEVWGWLEFQFNFIDSDNMSIGIDRWAYSAQGPVQAGVIVPGAGGIAALACGAAGLRRRRNRSAS